MSHQGWGLCLSHCGCGLAPTRDRVTEGDSKARPQEHPAETAELFIVSPTKFGGPGGGSPSDGGATITPRQVRAGQDCPFHALLGDGRQPDDAPAGAVPHHGQGQRWENTRQGPPKNHVCSQIPEALQTPSALPKLLCAPKCSSKIAPTLLCSTNPLPRLQNPSLLPKSPPRRHPNPSIPAQFLHSPKSSPWFPSPLPTSPLFLQYPPNPPRATNSWHWERLIPGWNVASRYP